MKKILSLLSLLAVLIIAACASSKNTAATPSTESFKVSGVCGMCQKRIETAAYGLAGVKSATWDVDKQLLTVQFDGKKATSAAIQQRIAAAGHDTETLKASETAYKKLPDCCRYREVAVHKD
jgi:copper chaperone CopZ